MSRLENQSKEFFDSLMNKNTYNSGDTYKPSHPNALSTGDDLGKGEVDGKVGSATDIATKDALLAKNKYTANNPYGPSTNI